MKRIQIIGLALLVLCGLFSQFTDLKAYPAAVWVIAGLAVFGMLLVLSEYFWPDKDKD